MRKEKTSFTNIHLFKFSSFFFWYNSHLIFWQKEPGFITSLELSYGFFFALRNFITSCCRSPSTSANLRLISEYLSCISFSSSSITLFLSLRSAISLDNSSICLVLDDEASISLLSEQLKVLTHSYFW